MSKVIRALIVAALFTICWMAAYYWLHLTEALIAFFTLLVLGEYELDKVTDKLDAMSGSVEDLKHKLDTMNGSVENLKDSLEDLKGSMEQLQTLFEQTSPSTPWKGLFRFTLTSSSTTTAHS